MNVSAVTIGKTEHSEQNNRQTKRRIGVYLPSPVFTHGQLYVALSRVGDFDAVEALTTAATTRNVVYREVL